MLRIHADVCVQQSPTPIRVDTATRSHKPVRSAHSGASQAADGAETQAWSRCPRMGSPEKAAEGDTWRELAAHREALAAHSPLRLNAVTAGRRATAAGMTVQQQTA